MVVGIIAEYNPFHNGHLKQIEYAKDTLKADYIVVALSPDFTQRGEIACLSKYERTRIALELGVNLVVQIPINAATDSAQGYAYGGVKVLDSLGIVDTLLFSCENEDTELLSSIADIELNENNEYLNVIDNKLKEGSNYPVARAETLISIISNDNTNSNGVPRHFALFKEFTLHFSEVPLCTFQKFHFALFREFTMHFSEVFNCATQPALPHRFLRIPSYRP